MPGLIKGHCVLLTLIIVFPRNLFQTGIQVQYYKFNFPFHETSLIGHYYCCDNIQNLNYVFYTFEQSKSHLFYDVHI